MTEWKPINNVDSDGPLFTEFTANVQPDKSQEPIMEKALGSGQVINPMQQSLFQDEDEIDLSDYEVVRPEFFAQIKEPAFTVNVDKISVNAACVRLLPDVDYVKILINLKEKKIVLLPCDDTEVSGYRWCRTKNGKRYSSQRSGEPFVLILCQIMDWNPDYRYQILGRMVNSRGKAVIAFDLTSVKCYPKAVNEEGKKVSSRRALFTAGEWNGKFGPKYSESRRSLQVDTFEGYTVISIKGKNVEGETMPAVSYQ